MHAGRREGRLTAQLANPLCLRGEWLNGGVSDGGWPEDWNERMAGQDWHEVLAVGRAVQARFHPVKMNYMTLGNTVPHLHTHIVPRYPNDPHLVGRSYGRTSSRPIPCPTPTFVTKQPSYMTCCPAPPEARQLAPAARHAIR
jgi:diadenosine tetraphosphate (Ap4A) HIT family hydrolase